MRFGSVFSKHHRFGSVRFVFFPVRRGSACVFRTRRGSARFGLVRFRVRFRRVPELNGSVRFLIPSCIIHIYIYIYIYIYAHTPAL